MTFGETKRQSFERIRDHIDVAMWQVGSRAYRQVWGQIREHIEFQVKVQVRDRIYWLLWDHTKRSK